MYTEFFDLGAKYFYSILLFVLLLSQQMLKIMKHGNLIFLDEVTES